MDATFHAVLDTVWPAKIILTDWHYTQAILLLGLLFSGRLGASFPLYSSIVRLYYIPYIYVVQTHPEHK